MKLFLLLTSFLFNASTWALVDIEDNGHGIESPLTNLRLSVADDVPPVILTSNEVTASTDGSTCLVKLVRFCITTWDGTGSEHEYEFYINGHRYYPNSGYVKLNRGCHSFNNLPVKSIPAARMELKTVEKDFGWLNRDDVAKAVRTIPSSCAGGPFNMKTSEGNTAVFELHAPPTASPTASPSSTPTSAPTPSPTKCMKWCRDEKWIGCRWWPKCPSGYKYVRHENGPCRFGTRRIVCAKSWRCPC